MTTKSTKAHTTKPRKPRTTTAKSDARFDAIRDAFVKAIEDGAADPNGWRMPWNRLGTHAPRNVASRARYTGTNHVLFAMAAAEADAPAIFGTFKQWEAKGLRRLSVDEAGHGFTGIRVVPVIKRDRETHEPIIDPATGKPETFPTLTVFVVHGIWQMVDAEGHEGAKAKILARFGYNADGTEANLPTGPEMDAKAEAFFAAIGAHVIEHGDRAYYGIATDHIQVPTRAQFHSAIGRYSTLAHEHGHWTGAASRLNRDGIARFDRKGSPQYAFEELIAELTAAFVCSALGFNSEARIDHAEYLASWLTKLRSDSRALFDAASAAEAAAAYLIKAAGLDNGDADIAEDDSDEAADDSAALVAA